MEVKEAIEKLEKSSVFNEWKTKKKDSYLVNGFMMIDVEVVPEWQIGYYDKNTDKITTFAVSKEITKNPESEVFKKESIVKPLDLSKVKLTFNEAIDKARKWQEDKYPGNYPIKKIVLLQNIEKENIYNITFITGSFKTLNIKISSIDGHVLSDKLNSIFDFQQK